ncbi:CBS domain-containing protein [Streptomyces sp. NPDC048338]|uniref:CBS domain-containing protein n=1 Tax=Streptomyces sp. NPDC048338 TaxID=3365536 RepID=UPI00371062EB
MERLKVADLMTDHVVSVAPPTQFRDVAKLLAEHDITGVPVLDEDDHVVGVVSETDLLAHRGLTARELMSAPAVTVRAEEPVADAARLMVRRGVERLPVVDEEDRSVGIVTRRDLLCVFLRPDAEIRRRVQQGVLAETLGLAEELVAVRVLNGVVTLDGRIRRRSQARAVVGLAEQVDGVVAVVDRLSVDEDVSRLTAAESSAHHPVR